MYTQSTDIRVRYSETDQMGYVYYGNYAQYYEVGRVEALRALGVRYREMEESGVMMPVLEMKTKYIRPAKYDDLLTIKTTIKKLPNTRITFHIEIHNGDQLINIGEVTLVFVDMKTGRPVQAPQWIIDKLSRSISG